MSDAFFRTLVAAGDIERARRGPGRAAHFTCGDMRATPFGEADAVVILDVLHYVDYAAQEEVLGRVRETLRGHRLERLWYRTLDEWLALLASRGFAAEPTPMSAGTPFANVLVVALAHPRPGA